MESRKTAYIPIDRVLALAQGHTLPEQSDGTALFADISGFTPLTERLRHILGERRGAEELTQDLNRVYDALITEVYRYGGTVISFSGDAITCWFDNPAPTTIQPGSSSALRAAAAAIAMQTAMHSFSALPLPDDSTVALAIKIAIASGPTRRFVVGDPAIQLIDVLAGATIERVATGEQLAQRGEIVIDAETAAHLGNFSLISEWRTAADSAARFAILTGLAGGVDAHAWPDLDKISLSDGLARQWLLPGVNVQLDSGQGEFMTELRPAVAIFLRFAGLNYEQDILAGQRLDQFVRCVQSISQRYDGTLLQLTVGDKGSYLYVVFGAPTAHEDDAHRAVNAAVALHALRAELNFLEPLQIGISQGTMRVGAYGSPSRRVYGVLGDEVNLAARLMQVAAPGQTLLSQRIKQGVGSDFAMETLPSLHVKGKRDTVTIFALASTQRLPSVHLQEPVYALPMIGRQQELALIGEKLELVLQRHGQIIAIVAEAGMGKSRLAAEAIRLAQRRQILGLGGECQSYGTNTSYLVWQPVWSSLLGVEPQAPLAEQIARVEASVTRLAPERLNALPLLATALNISLPENEFTEKLEPRYRKTALESLLLDCLKAAAVEAANEGIALFIVLEDLHWIDPASHDLLQHVARTIVQLPVCLLLVHRPLTNTGLLTAVQALPHFTAITLNEFSRAESEQLIRTKLAQFMQDDAAPVPESFIETISQRSQGNPFYVEELVNFMQDRDLDMVDSAALANLELPDSLQSLILSRIDQLTERQQTTLRVASIIGRLFRFGWLHGYYPALGEPEPLRQDLEILARLDITPLDTPEPELAYLFKHVITQEVAYESIGFATRAMLHEQFAHFLENQGPQDPARFLDLLAFHYDRSDNLPKKRHYLRRAGEAAARRYDNTAAVNYLSRALDLAPDEDLEERYALLFAREKIFSVIAAFERQGQDVEQLEAIAEQMQDNTRRAVVALRRSYFERARSRFDSSIEAAQRAIEAAKIAGSIEEELLGYVMWTTVLNMTGRFQESKELTEKCLRLAREHQRPHPESTALHILAQVAKLEGHYERAVEYMEQSIDIKRKSDDKVNLAVSLAEAANIARHMGNAAASYKYTEQALLLNREVGDQRGVAQGLRGLGLLAMIENNHPAAREYCVEALAISKALGDPIGIAFGTTQVGDVCYLEGNYEEARKLKEEALTLYQQLKNLFSVSLCYHDLCVIHVKLKHGDIAQAMLVRALQVALEVQSVQLYLVVFGEAAVLYYNYVNQAERAAEVAGLVLKHSATPVEILPMIEEQLPEMEAVLGKAGLAAAFERGESLDVENLAHDLIAALA